MDKILAVATYIGVIIMAVTVVILTYIYFVNNNSADKNEETADNKISSENKLGKVGLKEKTARNKKRPVSAVNETKNHDEKSSEVVNEVKVADSVTKQTDMPQIGLPTPSTTEKPANITPINIVQEIKKPDEATPVPNPSLKVTEETNQQQVAVKIEVIEESKNKSLTPISVISTPKDQVTQTASFQVKKVNNIETSADSNVGQEVNKIGTSLQPPDKGVDNETPPPENDIKENEKIMNDIKISSTPTDNTKPNESKTEATQSTSPPAAKNETKNREKESSLGDLSSMFSKEVEETSSASELAKTLNDVEIDNLTNIGQELLGVLKQNRG